MRGPYQNITIRDALLLTTGIAAGFAVFAPQFKDFTVSNFRHWIDAVCVGWAACPRRFRRRAIPARMVAK